MDRFATELILMEGSIHYGGPGGFSVATRKRCADGGQGADCRRRPFSACRLQCARCHDAPYHDFKQKDLFSLAAMLKREPQQVPLSSSIPTNANIVIGRVVNVTLKPGSRVEPAWPFPEVVPDDLPAWRPAPGRRHAGETGGAHHRRTQSTLCPRAREPGLETVSWLGHR